MPDLQWAIELLSIELLQADRFRLSAKASKYYPDVSQSIHPKFNI